MSERRELIVKIDGLRDVSAAQVAVDAGADVVGFIFAPARRQVAPEYVREIRAALQLDATRPQTIVGVFVNSGGNEIGRAAETSGVDAVQLSGEESPSILDEIDLPVIKALRFPAGTALDDAYAVIDAWYAAPRPVTRVIVDGHEPGSYGGTGAIADWDFVAALAARYPIMLAGGLTPENVVQAVELVNPAGVDVSSGVETDGEKDQRKIRSFVQRARSAAGTLS